MLTADAAFITGRDPWAIYEAVRNRLEPLNPFPTVRPFLRVDAAHSDPPHLLDYFGVSVNRYTLLDDAGNAVKPSGQVLGSILDPITHRKTHLGEGTPAWWREAWAWGVRSLSPGRPPKGPAWLDDPAPFVVSLTTPEQVASFHAVPGARPFAQVLLLGARFAGSGCLPAAILEEGRAPRDLVWTDARSGRRLRPFTRDGDTGDFIPETYRSFLLAHLRHPEAKSPDGNRRGHLNAVYEVVATWLRWKGKETVVPVGTEDLGVLLGGHEHYYVPDDRRDLRASLSILRALPRDVRADLARRLRVTPRRLRDILDHDVLPRRDLRGRIVTLAEEIHRASGVLPLSHDSHGILHSLRASGRSVPQIAKIAGVSERTVYRWLAGSRPHARALERFREITETQEDKT